MSLRASKTFVLTGMLSMLSRDEATGIIRDASSHGTGSVGKNTDRVLAGESPGSKLDKAQALGVKIIDKGGSFKVRS